MRIVHITNHFLPSAGGVEWSVLRTAEAQVRAGHEVSVITETPVGAWQDDELACTVHRFQVPVVRPITRLFYWRRMWGFRALLRSADVLHFHDYTVFVHWFLPLRPLIRGPRYAVTFHGFERWPVQAHHQFFRSLTAWLCHVRFGVGSYLRALYRHPIDAVYLGAPIREFPAMPQNDKMVFVYTGRLEKDTLLLPLVQLLRDAAMQTRIPVRLELAGSGSLRTELQELEHEGFEMLLHGQIEDTLPVLRNARYLVATGFLSLFEAFQTGIPVIVPAFNSMKQQYFASIEHLDTLATVLRSEQEAEEVLQGILKGALQSALQEKAERARAFVSEHTWDDISRILIQWYSTPRKHSST